MDDNKNDLFKEWGMVKRIGTVVLAAMLMAVSAEAKLITTDAVIAEYGVGEHKANVREFLERSDVIHQLEVLGVSPETAKLQVAMLTDEQATDLSKKIDSLPAGGDILGVALFVFLVLLVTDILGVTKVFPFTKPIR